MYKLTCIGYDKDGRGIVKLDNKVGFVKNLAFGEECVLKKIIDENKFFEAIIDNKTNTLVKTSKERVSLTYNGTCNLAHLSYTEQICFQEEITKNSFERSGLNFPKIQKCIYSQISVGYRNKAVLIANHELKYTRLGFFQERSNNFCLQDKNILYPDIINNLIFALNNELKENKITLLDVSKVIFRINKANDLQVTFLLNSNLSNTVSRLLELKSLKAKTISVHYIFANEVKVLKGNKYLVHEIKGIKYLINGLAFFQTNSAMVEQMYSEILNEITLENSVIDAFSGISTIGQFISKNAKKVYSIEINKDANLCAKECLDLNQITNLEILEGDFTKQFHKVKNLADAIVLDPPKAGVDTKAIQEINNSGLKKIIYLSCYLPSLIRDLKLLTNFEIRKIQPFKNFPQTAECETLVVLTRK